MLHSVTHVAGHRRVTPDSFLSLIPCALAEPWHQTSALLPSRVSSDFSLGATASCTPPSTQPLWEP